MWRRICGLVPTAVGITKDVYKRQSIGIKEHRFVLVNVEYPFFLACRKIILFCFRMTGICACDHRLGCCDQTIDPVEQKQMCIRDSFDSEHHLVGLYEVRDEEGFYIKPFKMLI